MSSHSTPQVSLNNGIKTLMRDRLPPEGLEKHENFVRQFRIYFKNQSVAAEVFKVTQVTVSKYLSGMTLISMPVAERFSKFTNGVVARDDIYFDYEAYLYDQKTLNESSKKHSIS